MPLKKILKLGEATEKNARLDSVRDDLDRLKMLWILSTTSPILYLAISSYVKSSFFNPPEEIGFARLPLNQFYWVAGACAVISVLVQAAHWYLRRRFATALGKEQHVIPLVRHYRNRTLALMAASELPVLLGFLLFLAQGDFRTVFVFGMASLCYYAQSYPSERLLGSYTKSS